MKNNPKIPVLPPETELKKDPGRIREQATTILGELLERGGTKTWCSKAVKAMNAKTNEIYAKYILYDPFVFAACSQKGKWIFY